MIYPSSGRLQVGDLLFNMFKHLFYALLLLSEHYYILLYLSPGHSWVLIDPGIEPGSHKATAYAHAVSLAK